MTLPVFLLAVLTAAGTPSPAASPSPAPAVSASVSPAASASPAPSTSPGASASPSASASPLPSASASTSKPGWANYVWRAKPTASPAPSELVIYEVDASDNVVVTPATYRARVVTSEPVQYVEAEVLGQTFNFVRDRPGEFSFSTDIPALPPDIKGTYPVVITASTDDGRKVTLTLTLTLS